MNLVKCGLIYNRLKELQNFSHFPFLFFQETFEIATNNQQQRPNNHELIEIGVAL